MNYLDIIIVIPLLYGLIKGFMNGLIKEVTGLLSLVVGIYVAVNFSDYLHPKFTEVLGGYEEFIPVISFATLFLISIILIKVLGYFADKLTNALALGIISRFLGSVFGVLKMVLLFSFLIVITNEYNLLDNKIKKKSVLYEPLKKTSDYITPQLKKHQSFLDKIEDKAEEAKQKIEERLNVQ